MNLHESTQVEFGAAVVDVANRLARKSPHTLTDQGAAVKVETKILEYPAVHLFRGRVTVPIIFYVCASTVLKCDFVNDPVLLFTEGDLQQSPGIEMA